MNQLFRLLLLFIASISLGFSASSQNLHDVAKFEVKGISLGSSPAQALKGLANYFSIDPNQIQIKRYRKPLEITGAENVPWEMWHRQDGLTVYAYFHPVLDLKDSHQVVVGSIHVETAKGNLDEMLDNAVALYGPYTVIKNPKRDKIDQHFLWCTEPNPSGFSECHNKYPMLSVSDGYMESHYGGYMKEWRQHVKEWEKENGTK